MTAAALTFAGATLARWGDGSFELTGAGVLVAMLVLGTFGTFVRELIGRRK